MESAGYVALTLAVRQEGKQFVSTCLELETTSCGDTIDEALANVREATTEYLNTIERMGERPRIFAEKGITVRKSRPSTIRREYELTPGSFVGSFVQRVPVPASA